MKSLRILLAHNRYRQAGGEDQVVARELAMLAANGNTVDLLAFDNEAIGDGRGRMIAAIDSFYSRSSRLLVEQRIVAFQPDLLHVHNFMPTLSPSVFFAAKAAELPVVQTLHNYRLVCANAQLFRDGATCEECLEQRSFLPGIRHACYRGSAVGSAIVGASMALHSILGTWEHRIDRYIALTQFAASKLTQTRVPREKVRIKPNFVADPGVGQGGEGFALFAARLSPEKGVHTLIAADAANLLPCPVYIVGEGPLSALVEQAASRAHSKLVFLGRKTNVEVMEWMKRADILLVPSLWYEGFPLVMVEAMACGLPILASRIGGLPELVEDGVSGILFTPGDVLELCEAVKRLLNDRPALKSMRRASRKRFEDHYSEAVSYRILMDLYGDLLQRA